MEKFSRNLTQQLSGGAGDRLRELKMTGLLRLTKIPVAMQFLQQHQLCTLLRRTLYTLNTGIEIRLTTVDTSMLYQSDG